MDSPDYSIVIPVYNSGKWLRELVSRIETTMGPLGASFEVILVNIKRQPMEGAQRPLRSMIACVLGMIGARNEPLRVIFFDALLRGLDHLHDICAGDRPVILAGALTSVEFSEACGEGESVHPSFPQAIPATTAA